MSLKRYVRAGHGNASKLTQFRTYFHCFCCQNSVWSLKIYWHSKDWFKRSDLGTDCFSVQRPSRLEINTSASWGQNWGPLNTSTPYTAVLLKRFQGGPQLGPLMPKDASFKDSHTPYCGGSSNPSVTLVRRYISL